MSDDSFLNLLPNACLNEINAIRQENAKLLAANKKGVRIYRNLLESILHLRAEHLDLDNDVVKIGTPEDIEPHEIPKLKTVLRSLMPWRKGPFSVFGIDIDSEWRSNLKWSRILPVLPDLQGKVIADIGASNGYYMFRMAQHDPALVLGFEPYLHHYFTFQILNHFTDLNSLHMEPMGVEQISLFETCFDVIFLMGIIYHRSSPIDMLRDLKKAMKPGGTLIVESQAIPGQDTVALFPEKRYAKVPGTYFVPTATCLANWLKRTGFKEVNIFFEHPMSSEEQRQTEWMVFESYADFIDSVHPNLTVEGYPAPIRVYLKAVA